MIEVVVAQSCVTLILSQELLTLSVEPIIDVARSTSKRLGIVAAEKFKIIQQNAWKNSGRARMTGDALMGIAGVATGNPMLMVAGFGGIAINGVLAKYAGNEGDGDPNMPFFKRVMSPAEQPVDTNAFWNAGRSVLLSVGGAYAAFAKGDIGQGIGAVSAGLVGLASNTLVLTRRALSRLGDKINVAEQSPNDSAVNLVDDKKLQGEGAEINVASSQHQVKGVFGKTWNAIKQSAKIVLKRPQAVSAMLAYPGIAAWAGAGVASVVAGAPVVGGIIIASASMHGLGMAFKMITPAIQTQLKEMKAEMSFMAKGSFMGTEFALRDMLATTSQPHMRHSMYRGITIPDAISLPKA